MQVKLKKDAALATVVNGLTVPLLVNEEKKPRYLALFMDLGTSSRFGNGRDASYISITTSRPQPKKIESKNGETSCADFYLPADDPSRLCINIRGHGPDVYPVIAKLGSALRDSLIWDATAAGTPLWLEEEEELQTKQLDPLGANLGSEESQKR